MPMQRPPFRLGSSSCSVEAPPGQRELGLVRVWLVAGLPGPVAVAVYAVVLSLAIWIVKFWLRARLRVAKPRPAAQRPARQCTALLPGGLVSPRMERPASARGLRAAHHPHTDEDDEHAAQTPFASLRTPRRNPYSQHEAMTRDARVCKMQRDVMQLTGTLAFG